MSLCFPPSSLWDYLMAPHHFNVSCCCHKNTNMLSFHRRNHSEAVSEAQWSETTGTMLVPAWSGHVDTFLSLRFSCSRWIKGSSPFLSKHRIMKPSWTREDDVSVPESTKFIQHHRKQPET